MQDDSRSAAFSPMRPINVTVMMAIGVISSPLAQRTSCPFVPRTTDPGPSRQPTQKSLQSIGGGMPRLRRDAGRFAVLDQAVEMHADVGCLGRGIGERDRLVEGDARFIGASELHEQRALDA